MIHLVSPLVTPSGQLATCQNYQWGRTFPFLERNFFPSFFAVELKHYEMTVATFFTVFSALECYIKDVKSVTQNYKVSNILLVKVIHCLSVTCDTSVALDFEI